MPTLYLIRGVPGSGKSTLARAIAQATHSAHLEADLFFMGLDGYRYDHKKIPEAHAWCQARALEYLKQGQDVAVANTFSRIWEMQPYLDMGFPVVVIECKGNWPNIHGCPEASIQKMRDRWEPFIATAQATV